jgi:hypothetical protein
MGLPQIDIFVPCKLDSEIIFLRLSWNEGMEETDCVGGERGGL